MRDHPSRDSLKQFLLGNLPAEQVRAVVAHLMTGCALCRSAMAPWFPGLVRPLRRSEELPLKSEDAYADAVGRACACALDWKRRLEREREEAPGKIARLLFGGRVISEPLLPDEPGFWTWGLCEVLLERSWGLRHDDPQGMLHLAALAREAADRLDLEVYGLEVTFDLRARAWGELANSCRVQGDLARAQGALDRALELRRQGSGAPLIRARLAEIAASLLCYQRRFPEAFRALDLARGLYERHGQPHDAGRMIVQKGLYAGRSGDPEEGIRLLARGLAVLDHDRDPKMVFLILHNILLFRVELGDFRDANLQLFEMRPLYSHHAGAVDLVKLRWLEGRIAAGLGELERAERAFRQVREDFERRGMIYNAAVVGLDLAALWLRQGRTAEVRRLVAGMLEVFRARYVAREAIAALLMLRDAAEREEATVDLLRMVAGILERVKEDPADAEEPASSL